MKWNSQCSELSKSPLVLQKLYNHLVWTREVEN